jgi:RHS repeat-associated protein
MAGFSSVTCTLRSDLSSCLLGNASAAKRVRRAHSSGKERDSESGLDNFTARYLGSSLGRFMSPDPMGGHQDDPQTLNRYAYVRNNPLKFTDPTGMNFGLPCSGGNTDTCNNGLQGSWQHDKDGNKTTFDPISIGNKDGQLQDVSSNKTGTYTASFDGSNVSLTNSSGATQNGSWLQGTAAAIAMAVSDLNKDGKPDLVIGNFVLSYEPPNVDVVFHQ